MRPTVEEIDESQDESRGFTGFPNGQPEQDESDPVGIWPLNEEFVQGEYDAGQACEQSEMRPEAQADFSAFSASDSSGSCACSASSCRDRCAERRKRTRVPSRTRNRQTYRRASSTPLRRVGWCDRSNAASPAQNIAGTRAFTRRERDRESRLFRRISRRSLAP